MAILRRFRCTRSRTVTFSAEPSSPGPPPWRTSMKFAGGGAHESRRSWSSGSNVNHASAFCEGDGCGVSQRAPGAAFEPGNRGGKKEKKLRRPRTDASRCFCLLRRSRRLRRESWTIATALLRRTQESTPLPTASIQNDARSLMASDVFAEARARARGKSARRTAIRPLLKRAVHEALGGDEDGARALGASERRRTNPERRPSAAYEKRPALVGRRMEKV